MIISWVTPLNLAGSDVVTYWKAVNGNVISEKKKARASTSSYRFYDYTSGFLHHATIKGLEVCTSYTLNFNPTTTVLHFYFFIYITV